LRLSQEIKKSIIYYAQKYFGYNIKLYLFGSCTDDNKKGGDIDLCRDGSCIAEYYNVY